MRQQGESYNRAPRRYLDTRRRDRRDREELGRPPLEEQERALQEDVMKRREREAAENE
jgi:hypothetical protein